MSPASTVAHCIFKRPALSAPKSHIRCYRRSLAIFHRTQGMGFIFPTNRDFVGILVQVAVATAGVRAILVHSGPGEGACPLVGVTYKKKTLSTFTWSVGEALEGFCSVSQRSQCLCAFQRTIHAENVAIARPKPRKVPKKVLTIREIVTFRTSFWSKNRTGENRTGEPRPSTRGPFRGHLRGMFRGESLKG